MREEREDDGREDDDVGMIRPGERRGVDEQICCAGALGIEKRGSCMWRGDVGGKMVRCRRVGSGKHDDQGGGEVVLAARRWVEAQEATWRGRCMRVLLVMVGAAIELRKNSNLLPQHFQPKTCSVKSRRVAAFAPCCRPPPFCLGPCVSLSLRVFLVPASRPFKPPSVTRQRAEVVVAEQRSTFRLIHPRTTAMARR